MQTPAYPPLPDDLVSKPKYAVIGGSGVTVAGEERFSFKTSLGWLVNISFLDQEKRVLFVNRHLCTSWDESGKATYAPPHVVDFHVILYGLKKLNVKGVCAIGSTGSLRPKTVPVGSIVMPDDYAFVLPAPVTFWGKIPMGTFQPSGVEEGKIHFAPASKDDSDWVNMRSWVQKVLAPVLKEHQGKIKMAEGQEEKNWPSVFGCEVGVDVKLSYVQTCGPRFETRSEIQTYATLGHIVGMTCASEWTLAQELCLPYVLVCAVDNSANGLSLHPGGPVQEYLDHKGDIAEVTSSLVKCLTTGLGAGGPDGKW
mmetsp:Transcript_43526/g.137709  ORF Transcript_43526/g.137709 Transcript_43526/m.137709 type:complete len:311 (-) Transcript_43526:834-1766(-)